MGLPTAIIVLISCYALGCVLPSYYVVKWKTGRDVRETGSGNAGATNAGRLLGRGAYVVLALLDIAKGWAAMAVASSFGLTGWWLAGAGIAVVAGHLWPAQLGFRGGKGMTASYGAILFVSPWTALFMWVVLGLAWLVLRSLTLGAVQGYLSAPLLAMTSTRDYAVIGLCFIMAMVVAATHRRNIREVLLRRRERANPNPESPAA